MFCKNILRLRFHLFKGNYKRIFFYSVHCRVVLLSPPIGFKHIDKTIFQGEAVEKVGLKAPPYSKISHFIGLRD